PEKLASVSSLSMEDILTPICVIFVGSSPPSHQWLEETAKPLIVRRKHVLATLKWLKENNPLYTDVDIVFERIASLPAHGLLPHEIQQLSAAESTSLVASRYNQVDDSVIDDTLSLRNMSRDCVDFHKVVVTDVNSRAPMNELRAATIRHIKHKGGEYMEVPHLPQPVNEFCNPSLFPMIYPSLYPYGIGGFKDGARHQGLLLKRHVRHL
ncbi:hypothetical protein GY45DRAFT_1220441, partial [Cubamyces sp. BRFM 1775]